jgi:phosphopentomutase
MPSKVNSNRRAIVVIIDGCGIGAAPDVREFGDPENANSLANTAKKVGGLNLPNLARLGLGKVTQIQGVSASENSSGFFGKLQEISAGKDTQTGHWELMGLINQTAFPTYPEGFPPEVLGKFIEETGCKNILCNKPISGTDVLDQLGEEHQKTGYPIVYTSGDSVFQIACHVETVPLATLYKWCQIARNILQGAHRVGRVIARPFAGVPGKYERLGGDRRDFSVPPPGRTLLDILLSQGRGVLGIGKIEDIFDRHGLSHAVHTGSNKEGLELTLQAVQSKLPLAPIAITENAPQTAQFIFTNLVDTDMLYGHRRNVEGYAKALEEIDQWLGKIMEAMGQDDMLIITSDHGNDPTAPGTDHTREFVPVLAYVPSLNKAENVKIQRDLGVRDGFTDVCATLAAWLEVKWEGPGKSFISELATARVN